MNRFRSLTAIERLAEGDIVEFSVRQSGIARRAGRDTSYGYIHHRVFDAQENLTSFSVFEILPAEQAQGLDRRYRVINQQDAGGGLGLHAGKTWAIVIDPIFLRAEDKFFSRQDGLAQRVGNIAGTAEESRLKELVETIGEDRIYFTRGDGPNFAQPRADMWGIYAPVGITRQNFDDEAFKPAEKTGKRRAYKKKGAVEGKVLDISLENAVRALGLKQSIADLFEKPSNRLKAVHSLRDVWDMANKDAERLEKYIPTERRLPEDISFDALQDDLFPAVFNGLRQPKGDAVQPIATLQEAYELVTQRPGDLAQYKYMGDRNRAVAIEEITAIYERLSVEGKSTASVGNDIKAAWSKLTDGYMQSIQTQDIPPSLKAENGKPLWMLRQPS